MKIRLIFRVSSEALVIAGVCNMMYHAEDQLSFSVWLYELLSNLKVVSKHTNTNTYTLFTEHILHILRSTHNTVLVWQKLIIILKTETFNLYLILDKVYSAADEVKAWIFNMTLTTFFTTTHAHGDSWKTTGKSDYHDNTICLGACAFACYKLLLCISRRLKQK